MRNPIVGGFYRADVDGSRAIPGKPRQVRSGASTAGLSHCGMQRVIVIASITDMVITIVFLARFDCGADVLTTRETAHMNLNTALMSHLQKPPMAL